MNEIIQVMLTDNEVKKNRDKGKCSFRLGFQKRRHGDLNDRREPSCEVLELENAGHRTKHRCGNKLMSEEHKAGQCAWRMV